MRMQVYILNMPQRQERKLNVMQEFADKPEFATHFVMPVKHQIPSISHWLTFYELVKQAQEQGLDYFVFCEDDHIFTSDYEEREFFRQVAEAGRLEADILLGGVSSMKVPIQITDHLFWLHLFNGTQFVIVFKRFYNRLLECGKDKQDVVTDYFISSISGNIFVMYPFISIQKEFGYSDVTSFNNKKGYVDGLFHGTSKGLEILNKVRRFYNDLR